MTAFFRFYFRYFWLYKYAFLFGILCIFLTNYILVKIPQYISRAVDLIGAQTSAERDTMLISVIALMGLAVSLIAIRTLSRVMFFNSARRIEYRIKNDLFQTLMHLPKGYFDRNPSGQVISRINNDINGVRLLYGFGSLQVINIAFSMSLTPYMMYQISPSLTLYLFFPVAVSFAFITYLLGKLSVHMDKRQEELRRLSDFVVSSLSGINEIKSYSMFEWANISFGHLNRQLYERTLKMSVIRALTGPVLNNIDHMLKLIILTVGGLYVMRQELTVGDMAAMMVYGWILSVPVGGMGWITNVLQESVVNVRSLRTILESPPLPAYRLPNPEVSAADSIAQKGLQIKNLAFRHDGKTRDTLNGVSFDIPPGKIIGVLGGVGSGKSTLADCINGYLEPPAGMIYTGDDDLTRFPLKELREAIKTASENPFLFSATVEENICFGNCRPQDISEARWADILERAALTDEVSRFPQQRQTLVGEKGIMLSGGQKQRISLARALLTPCSLLILDNVLSAVDYETERRLIRSILNENSARSLLIISHRTDVMQHADNIIVLEDGKIIETGTHSTLMAQHNKYSPAVGVSKSITPRQSFYTTYTLGNVSREDTLNLTVKAGHGTQYDLHGILAFFERFGLRYDYAIEDENKEANSQAIKRIRWTAYLRAGSILVGYYNQTETGKAYSVSGDSIYASQSLKGYQSSEHGFTYSQPSIIDNLYTNMSIQTGELSEDKTEVKSGRRYQELNAKIKWNIGNISFTYIF
ncbi:hypothetical protein CHS0354_035279 [Potamilus streckersoni]|uniref:ABC transporter ATP-binding protein n=1 Tax=Potamilus streckersoni TaxID=2493646 RepID=A0AAE0S339_9BIVA|nr:hypothetical protein CHS0354_035279 [Potamilus streckersoni]